jgi:hypothetical protein
VPRGLAVLNRFLPPLPRHPSILLAERTVIRKGAKRTSTRRNLGALSRLEICGRAHDVRSSGSCQNTQVRDSVSKAGQYSTGWAGRESERDGGKIVRNHGNTAVFTQIGQNCGTVAFVLSCIPADRSRPGRSPSKADVPVCYSGITGSLYCT